jgi:uncharacterized damage-inducible protein DinB
MLRAAATLLYSSLMDQLLGPILLNYAPAKLEQLAGRIRDCMGRLTDDQIWWRGNENQNAAGNLVLHLCGNARQWIGYGVAGEPDIRRRDEEFEARGGANGADLMAHMDRTVQEALSILRTLPAERLAETTSVQGYTLTRMEAILHVLEHFSMHTGQIILITKMLTGEDLGYYRHLSRNDHSPTTP